MPSLPLSIRLDDDVRATLSRDAEARHVSLATYLRDLATERAEAIRRREIREATRRAAEAIAANPERQADLEAWDEIGISTV